MVFSSGSTSSSCSCRTWRGMIPWRSVLPVSRRHPTRPLLHVTTQSLQISLGHLLMVLSSATSPHITIGIKEQTSTTMMQTHLLVTASQHLPCQAMTSSQPHLWLHLAWRLSPGL